jgi:hypothetical protein
LDMFVLSLLRSAPSSTVYRRGWSIAQCLMESLLVVPHHVTYQPLACVVDAWVVVPRHLLRLHRTPSPLHTHVIQRSAATSHPETDASWLQPCRERLTGALDPLVRMEHLGASVPECLLQRLDTQ